MAQVYQLDVAGDYTQPQFDQFSHSLLFADSIVPISIGTPGDNGRSIVVTSNVESTGPATSYVKIADDSQSETSIDISTGKFVDGNVIAVLCLTSEAQSDMRNFVTYFAPSGDVHLHVGLCNTTQSQDYTPDIVAESRVLKMMTPAQVKSINL